MKSFEIAIWQIIIERWLIEFWKDFPNAYCMINFFSIFPSGYINKQKTIYYIN